MPFYGQLEQHGANDKLAAIYGDYLKSCGGGGDVVLTFKIANIPENHEELAIRASRLKRNCYAALFEKYFNAQVPDFLAITRGRNWHILRVKVIKQLRIDLLKGGCVFSAAYFFVERQNVHHQLSAHHWKYEYVSAND